MAYHLTEGDFSSGIIFEEAIRKATGHSFIDEQEKIEQKTEARLILLIYTTRLRNHAFLAANLIFHSVETDSEM